MLGCTATSTTDVTILPVSFSGTVVVDATCPGGSNGSIATSVSGGTAPYTYSWSNGETTSSITNLSAGTYTATVTDNNGCTAICSVNIVEPSPILVSASNDSPVCSGSVLNFTASSSGGTGSHAYSWSGPDGFTSSLQNPFINNATTNASGTYTVAITDNNGCSATVTTTATVNICTALFDVKLFLQGYYAGGGALKPVLQNQNVAGATSGQADTITVALHNTSSPYAMVESYTGILGTNGIVSCSFSPSAAGNSYYLVIRHRNSVETWSANPVTILSAGSYDFTTTSSRAYHNNQKEVEPGVWALFNGDVTQDGICNGLDFNLLEADVRTIATGYKTTDVNGDGIVNGLDFNLVEGNVRLIVGVKKP
jgi:hypothetical protein